MKEEWLFRGALVPIDAATTAALVAEIKRLIDVVGGMALAQPEQEPTVPATAYDRLFALNEANAARIIELEAAQQEQEPVAWMSDQDVGFKKSEFGATATVPLYTTPPKRP